MTSIQTPFRLPGDTKIGQVQLIISELSRSLSFYRDLLGFALIEQEKGEAILSATGYPPALIQLVEISGALPKPPRTTGLYHVAIRLPDRPALARVLAGLIESRWPLQGAADHLVSEAIYLADADGNGLELYVDRPRDKWPRVNEQVQMATDPLDLRNLLSQAQLEHGAPGRIHSGTDIGHIHLQVSHLGKAEEFYSGLLGLEVTQRSYPGALFLSAGGYHHHLGLNTWGTNGASRPPDNSIGLHSFKLAIPNPEIRSQLQTRLQSAEIRLTEQTGFDGSTISIFSDPDGNKIAV